MPIITTFGIANGEPCAIAITVSEERYKYHKETPVKNPIPALEFKEFLNEFRIPFEEHSSSTILYGTEFFALAIWSDAKFFDAVDIKNAMKTCEKKSYADFIDWYAEKLKTI